jgi:hypothetical protein
MGPVVGLGLFHMARLRNHCKRKNRRILSLFTGERRPATVFEYKQLNCLPESDFTRLVWS